MIKNKRGQLALDVVEGVVLKVLIIAILGVAVILALTTLSNSNIFTPLSAGANSTSQITGNVSDGVTSFFGSIGTVFSILLAVVLISAVAIIVLVVRRFAGSGTGSVSA